MPTAIEDIVESVTNGVLRALDARHAANKSTASVAHTTANLLSAGFFVDFHIRYGGIPGPVNAIQIESALNPQPLPPGKQ